jgi:hypothetical protein
LSEVIEGGVSPPFARLSGLAAAAIGGDGLGPPEGWGLSPCHMVWLAPLPPGSASAAAL